MRKLFSSFLLITFVLITFVLISPPPASAQCTPSQLTGCQSENPTDCAIPVSGEGNWCCTDPEACTVLQNAYTQCATPDRGTCSGATPIKCNPRGIFSANRCCSDQESCNILQSGGASAPGVAPPAAGAPAAGASTPTCDAPGGDSSEDGTPTALGCIPNQPAAAIKLILPWAIGLGTGLAFLLFLYGAFTLITAGSDPQKVDTGKSIITSAAAGLIFIILSVILLRVIGIDILKL